MSISTEAVSRVPFLKTLGDAANGITAVRRAIWKRLTQEDIGDVDEQQEIVRERYVALHSLIRKASKIENPTPEIEQRVYKLLQTDFHISHLKVGVDYFNGPPSTELVEKMHRALPEVKQETKTEIALLRALAKSSSRG